MVSKTSNRDLIYWTIQLSAWGFISAIIGTANVLQEGYSFRTLVQTVEIFIALILSSHSIRVIFIRRNWFDLPMPVLILRILILIITLATALISFLVLLNWFIFKEELPNFGAFLINVILYSIFLILWSSVYLANHLFRKSHIQELHNLQLQTTQSQNELKALRDQLNPHFLFNSLNNIRALIEIDPPSAKTAITTLSSLLRSSLVLGKKTSITMQEELKLVNEYLELEKIRFEERLNYTIDSQVSESVTIPPFIIQGMVENAIKHGISKSSNPRDILIKIHYIDEKLIIEVINDGTISDDVDTGIGVFNTKRRLQILYGEEAGFSMEELKEEEKVRSYIWINEKHLNQLKHESNNH